MKSATKKSAYLALFANIFLFGIKIVAGLFSHSIALLSDAINSLTDVIASLVLVLFVKVSHKRADKTHPFGHHRAEPIGGLIVAVIAGFLGFEVMRSSVVSLFRYTDLVLNEWIYFVVFLTIIIKGSLYFYFKHYSRKQHNPTISALAYDSINDVLVSSLVLINFVLYKLHVPYVDGLFGLIIGGWVIKNGYSIAIENIDYLMGRSPSEEVVEQIKKVAESVSGVKKVTDVAAHYVGLYVHAEIHIDIDKKTELKISHDIGKEVREKVQDLGIVDRAFIHIDAA